MAVVPVALAVGTHTWGLDDAAKLESILDLMRKHKVGHLDTARYYIRTYFLHGPDEATPIEQQMESIQALYQQGLFTQFGLSNFNEEQVLECYNCAKSKGYILPTVYQSSYSLATRLNETILFPTLRDLGFQIQAYSPMAAGLLAKTPEYIHEGKGSWDPSTVMGKMYRDLFYKPSYMEMLEEFGKLSDKSGVSRSGLAYRWVRYHSALKGNLGDEMILGAASAAQLEESLMELEKGPLENWVVERIDELWDIVKEDAPRDNMKSARKFLTDNIMPTVNIAVLKCYQMQDSISKVRGDFDALFQSWLSLGAETISQNHPDREAIQVKVVGYDIAKDEVYPDTLNDVDAIVITGSPAAVYEDLPWIRKLQSYLQDVYSNYPNIKLFGGCFGHQIIAQALLGDKGAQVELSPKGLEVGVHQVQLAADFTRHFPGLLHDVGEISYQLFHVDHVNLSSGPLPYPWINIGSSKLCDVQGLYNPGRVLTFQGHPEFDTFITRECVLSLGENWSEQMVADSLVLAEKADERVLVAQVAVEFLKSQDIAVVG
ncbi:hypothetical protein G7Z17_g7793 [Cylindrodendrum hubeiense]|uniref:Class I glutamine amidotransferase-like protein n=1 Tax=Cylindrodendrum hubeiense TaxID=595255 RepID=A0A9P5H7P0_9HYPO|nr:hypothetical protein G7Z17_g7793 [Cylindrodendrum hubeiense]